MATYFGTDGIRGIYGEELSSLLVHKCGNSLARLCTKRKVLIGRDTRQTGGLLTLSFASGLTAGGVDVVDVGIAPTPVIAFLTKKLGFDFGVVISASHNPPQYNGVKIYDENGYKINEEVEKQIERKLFSPFLLSSNKVGSYTFDDKIIKEYKNSLLDFCQSLEGLKIVVDCANGATAKLAKAVFSSLGGKIIYLNATCNGSRINDNCGALYPGEMIKAVLQNGADMGVAFDGDGDRISACDEKGNLLDGDDILYLLATYYPECHGVVGTSMTNKGLENLLAKKKIPFFRADVGDKYVVEMMKNKSCTIGGEPSGHIVNFNLTTTGDGILTALTLAQISIKNKKSLSKLAKLKKFPQINKNISVVDKFRILNSEKLSSEILAISQAFGKDGRVLVRASGTENKIRIMCEHKQKSTALSSASRLESLVLEINKINS